MTRLVSKVENTPLTRQRLCYFGTISHNLKTIVLYCLSSSAVCCVFLFFFKKSVTISLKFRNEKAFSFVS